MVDVRYVMFHDGTVEQKGPWEFIKLDVDIECPRRLSAYPKINPHKYFDKGYIKIIVFHSKLNKVKKNITVY